MWDFMLHASLLSKLGRVSLVVSMDWSSIQVQIGGPIDTWIQPIYTSTRFYNLQGRTHIQFIQD